MQRPSEAITVESPIRKLACMILFSEPGGTMPAAAGPGLSLKRISIVTSAPSALLVELDRLLAAAVEEQIGLDLHGISSYGFGLTFYCVLSFACLRQLFGLRAQALFLLPAARA